MLRGITEDTVLYSRKRWSLCGCHAHGHCCVLSPLLTDGLGSPYGLAIHGDLIFWTELNEQGLYLANQTTGSNTTQVITRLSGLQEVRIIRTTDLTNACKSLLSYLWLTS